MCFQVVIMIVVVVVVNYVACNKRLEFQFNDVICQ